MKSTTFAILALIGSASFIGCRDDGTEDSGGSGAGTSDGAGSQGGSNNPDGGGPSGAGNQGGNGSCTETPGQEDIETACGDGIDNDCDDFEDCTDFDCEGIGKCIKPGEANNYDCADGLDNDEDGFTDCDDNDGMPGEGGCQKLAACKLELSNAKCSDGMDNDADGDNDCDDTDCQTEGIVVCDGTTPVDVAPGDYEMMTNEICTNGINDDVSAENTFIDCNDRSCLINPDATECRGLPREATNALCSDGIDNDKDSVIDCADSGCNREGIVVCDQGVETGAPMAQWATLANTACSNGDTDDGNTFIDCDDFGCTQNPDVDICPETNDADCDDGVDNNDNTYIDCIDFSCSLNPNVTVCGPLELSNAECLDGISNNGDPFIDCNDFDCEDAAPCLVGL